MEEVRCDSRRISKCAGIFFLMLFLVKYILVSKRNEVCVIGVCVCFPNVLALGTFAPFRQFSLHIT